MTRPSGDTALVVAVPEAEPAVGEWRLVLDPSADQGVPAHITVLFPFVPAAELDDDTLRLVEAVCAGHEPFEFTLAEVRWFGEELVYLAPQPEERFRHITAAVFDAFPAHPPYEGMHEDTVPHLTLGQEGPMEEMRRAAQEVAEALPIRSRAEAVDLIVLEAGIWGSRAQFPLGGA